jgi:hypothetical protein
MPETNYRALCVELLQFGDQAGEIAAMEGLWPDCDPGPDSLLDRARAALAQPEPEGPVKYNEDFWRKDALEKLVYAATAFRLGIYSAEELEIAENRARFFLARWGRPTIEPVPVSERLPGEGDCDESGRCWWLTLAAIEGGRGGYSTFWELTTSKAAGRCASHWLPHHALPVPGAEVG